MACISIDDQRRKAGTIPAADPGARLSPLAALSLRSGPVTIGPVLPEDTAAIFLWLNDVQSASLDLPFRPTDWMHYNSWLESFGKNANQVLFAIRPVCESHIVGFLALTKIDPIHRSAELAIRIGAEADRGKGFGQHAIRLALDYGWKHLNLQRIQLSVFDFNRRAIGAYQACGFEMEGKLRQAAYINGEWTDVVLMSVLRP